MSEEASTKDSVVEFLSREALALDRRDWGAWLDLYDLDAEYWVPTWDDVGRLTHDPGSQISHIYYDSRAGLEERIHRILGGKSAASKPLARTCHFFQVLDIQNVVKHLRVETNWRVDCFRLDEASSNFGYATYELYPRGNSWIIKRKKVVVLNDIIDSVLDVYMI